MNSTDSRPAIAVVGLGALFPGSQGVQGFWRGITGARDAIADVPATHWRIGDYYDPDPRAVDRIYARRGAFLDGAALDVARLGIPPKTLASTDSAQLLALVVAEELLSDSRARFGDLPRDRMSVILGVASTTELCAHMASRMQRPAWMEGMRRAGLSEDVIATACEGIAAQFTPWDENVFPGLLGNVVAGRIANRFDLGGSNFVTDAACASSLSAVAMGLNELYLGDSDAVIAGGVDCLNDILMYTCFSKTGALSPSDDCRPFAEGADGTALGEGLGMLMLRRLDDAERDGNHVYAVIRGCGASSDGRARSIYAPRASGQERALRRAYAAAGYSPATVELVEAHGTGTAAGDRAEVEALRAVFEEGAQEHRRWCALGSIKSQLGHTKAAAGAAGLIKAVLAVHEGVLPPTLKVERPNPELGLDVSAFYVNSRTRPWVRAAEHPRRAAVSAFGFGGSNFHVTVEEYRGDARAPRLDPLARGVALLAAQDAAGLAARARALAELRDPEAIAFQAWHGQQHADASLPARAAIVAEDEAGIARGAALLAERLQGDEPAPEGMLAPGVHLSLAAPEPGRVAFLFPGQGSQYVDMGAGLACRSRVALDTWDEAANLLALAPRLHEVVFPPPAFDADARAAQCAALRGTEWAQPAIAVASVALLRVLDACGVRADAVAGHSFGELVALHAAGVLCFADLLAAARQRGELMALAAADAPGAMLALSGEPGDLDRVLAALPEGVVLANHNSPRQRVVSGEAAAIEGFAASLAPPLHASRLDVAAAFHSPLMQPAEASFLSFLAGIAPRAPRLPVHGCADARPLPEEAQALRARLARQLVAPVRFAEQVDALYAAGARTFVEVGPGQVLSRLAGECLAGRPHVAVALDRRGANAATALADGLARLWLAGVRVEWPALWGDVRVPDDPAEREVPRHAVMVTGVHPGKPVPGSTPARSGIGAAAPEAPTVGGIAAPGSAAPRAGGGVAMPAVPRADVGAAMPAVSGADGGAAMPAVPRADVGAAMPTESLADHAAPEFVSPLRDPGAAVMPAAVAPGAEHTAGLAQVQMAFQRSMLEAHLGFLRAIGGASLEAASVMPESGASAEAAGAASPVPRAASGAAEVMLPPAPGLAGATSPREGEAAWMAAAPGPGAADGRTQPPAAATAAMPPPAAATAANPVPAPAGPVPDAGPVPAGNAAAPPAASPAACAGDLARILIDVVAQSTGYPPDVIALDADLEGDLGIDSIKRVEILAAFQERVPGMPEPDAGTLGSQRTLSDILALLRPEEGTAPAVAAGAASEAPDAPAASPLAATSNGATEHAASAPPLAATANGATEHAASAPPLAATANGATEHAASAPPLAATANGATEHAASAPPLAATANGAAGHAASAPPVMVFAGAPHAPSAAAAQPVAHPAPGQPAAAAPALDAKDLLASIVEVVAESTGYPADVIDADADLEGDLGIDSIKRVEILAAVAERFPHLPEPDAARLGALRSLGEIAACLVDSGTAAAGDTRRPVLVASQAAPARDAAPAIGQGVTAATVTLQPAPRAGGEIERWRACRRVLVSGDETLARALAARLREARIAAEPAGDAGGPVNPDTLAASGDVDGLVCLDALTPGGDVAHALAVAARVFSRVKAAAGGLENGCLVTLHDTAGSFALERCTTHDAWSGGLPGLVKCAAAEWPRCLARAIDIERGDRSSDEFARAIAEEIIHGKGAEIALAGDGTRRAPEIRLAGPHDHCELPFESGAVVIASGGGRGVTATCLEALAARVPLRLALFGRTAPASEDASAPGEDAAAVMQALHLQAVAAGRHPTPAELRDEAARVMASREAAATATRLRALGCEVEHVAVDVRDAAAVSGAVARVRERFGPIAGLVHGAGVIADARIEDKSEAWFEHVVATKAGGFANLLRACEGDPLRAIVAFSSVSARYGNAGQSDYALANEILNRVCRAEARRRAGRCIVRSLNWGPWNGGMVTPALARNFERQGISLLDPEAGAALFLRALGGAAEDVEWLLTAEPGTRSVARSAG